MGGEEGNYCVGVQVTLMLAADNHFNSDSGAALGRSLSALTALQILNLSSES